MHNVRPKFCLISCLQKWPTLATQGKIQGQGIQVRILRPKSSITQQSFLNQKTYLGANLWKKSPLSTTTIWIHVSFYNPQYPVASSRSLTDVPASVSVSWKGVKINSLFIYSILCIFLYILHHIPPYSLFQGKQFLLNESLFVWKLCIITLLLLFSLFCYFFLSLGDQNSIRWE